MISGSNSGASLNESSSLGYPKGWCVATVGDTGDYINGFAFKPSHRQPDGRPIIRIQNLTDPDKPLNRTALSVPAAYHVASGEMLVSWSATVDVFVWNREPALVNQHIFRVVPDEAVVDRTFLFHWLKVAIDQLLDSEHLHGSTMKHINRGPFMAHEIPLPPRPEQERIAQKLEELLSDLDSGVAELKAARRKLAQFRQSLLKAAVEGALTADWRAARAQTGEPQETGAELLQRILTERRSRWEANQIARFAKQGKTPPKDWQAKYEEPMSPDTTDLPALPDGWVWASVDQLCPDDIANGRSVPTAEHGAQVLRLTAVKDGRIDVAEHKIGAWTNEEAKPFAITEGDLLVVRGNGSLSLVGRLGLVDKVFEQVAYPDTMIRVRVLDAVALPNWVARCWDTRYTRTHLENRARTSAGIFKISQPDIISVPIPVPSIGEQNEIISLLSRCDEAMNATADALSDGIRQSSAQRKNILKAAFAGQLVAQDHNDEPAGVLLERIRAERATSDTTTKRGRKPGTTA